MSAHPHDTDAWASRTTRNTLGLAAWTAAWVASVALAAFGPEFLWNNQPAPTLVAIAFNVWSASACCSPTNATCRRWTNSSARSSSQAMAWSLGAGLVGGVAWSLFARYDLVGFEAEIGHLIAFMAVVYLAGFVAGLLRYR